MAGNGRILENRGALRAAGQLPEPASPILNIPLY